MNCLYGIRYYNDNKLIATGEIHAHTKQDALYLAQQMFILQYPNVKFDVVRVSEIIERKKDK